ncbi:hypothetical protein [Massilia aerilata]|uniref:Uncharacterized protein n=1 Tax=Massilia aerilata TaxID=453817 RepID=A0ABW0S1F1_9BURK
MIKAIIEAMKFEIAKYHLELLQRHPKDLDIDMAMLERFVSPGLKYAWMVGDSHTHAAALGIHQNLNELPTYVTRLANNDRFYLLTVGKAPEQFTLKEVDRVAFAALANTPIPYRMVGPVDSFWLYRNESRVGTCVVTREGTFEKPVYKIALTPMAGIGKIDREALQEWGQQAVTKKAGSLFARSQVEWLDPIKLALAA